MSETKVPLEAVSLASSPPDIKLNGIPFGASAQQLCSDAALSSSKIGNNWIKYLTTQGNLLEMTIKLKQWLFDFKSIFLILANDTTWRLKEKEDWEMATMLNSFTIRKKIAHPNEAFNYLIIFLKHLPSPLLPKIYFGNKGNILSLNTLYLKIENRVASIAEHSRIS